MKARIVPFVTYLGFVGLEDALIWAAGEWPNHFGEGRWLEVFQLWLYPTKIAVVLGLLVYFWPSYSEIRTSLFARPRDWALALGAGLFVYLTWVRMDWSWAVQGATKEYNPFQGSGAAWPLLAATRLVGAATVVPIMEELFWRSFLARYIISSRFESVPIAAFSVPSFLLTVVLFGSEHQFWLAGMLAGAVYNVTLYRTGRLGPCILAHATTNVVLGIHVLVTGEWKWW